MFCVIWYEKHFRIVVQCLLRQSSSYQYIIWIYAIWFLMQFITTLLTKGYCVIVYCRLGVSKLKSYLPFILDTICLATYYYLLMKYSIFYLLNNSGCWSSTVDNALAFHRYNLSYILDINRQWLIWKVMVVACLDSWVFSG